MSIDSHIAILLGHSLHEARMNKKKTRAEFYAQVALPLAAATDVAALVSALYPGVPLGTIEVNFKTNAQQEKPFPGVPADWCVLRMASQYAPELYAADGVTPIPVSLAKQHFFAGMRVRINTSAWPWKNDFGKSGASFNLHGLMDAGLGGDRLQIGGGAGSGSVFASHANPNAVPQTGITTALAAKLAGNPFAAQQTQQVPPTAAAVSANPFAQAAPASAANPFAQA